MSRITTGNTTIENPEAYFHGAETPSTLHVPALCKVQKAMMDADALLSDLSEFVEKVCGAVPEVPGVSGPKQFNGYFGALTCDALALSRSVDKARAALNELRREFP